MFLNFLLDHNKLINAKDRLRRFYQFFSWRFSGFFFFVFLFQNSLTLASTSLFQILLEKEQILETIISFPAGKFRLFYFGERQTISLVQERVPAVKELRKLNRIQNEELWSFCILWYSVISTHLLQKAVFRENIRTSI